MAHRPGLIDGLRRATVAEPLRVLVSACMTGVPCGVDGTDYGMGGATEPLADCPIRWIPFCPEDHGLGTPRSMPDIHGGDGRDVLAGKAEVLGPDGENLTAGMLNGAQRMLELALGEHVECALLTDMSAACGSQVISDGCRLVENRRFRMGVGVAAALLMDHGIPVISQRDFRTLALLRQHLIGGTMEEELLDHHQSDWYRRAFGFPDTK